MYFVDELDEWEAPAQEAVVCAAEEQEPSQPPESEPYQRMQ